MLAASRHIEIQDRLLRLRQLSGKITRHNIYIIQDQNSKSSQDCDYISKSQEKSVASHFQIYICMQLNIKSHTLYVGRKLNVTLTTFLTT
jgi:hypothetical protein